MLTDLTTPNQIKMAARIVESISDIALNLELIYARNGALMELQELYNKLSSTFSVTVVNPKDNTLNDRIKLLKQYYQKKSDLMSNVTKIQKQQNVLLARGKQYSTEGNHDEAIKLFDEAFQLAKQIQDKTGILKISYEKAFSLLSKGFLEEALVIYKDLSESDPKGKAYFYLGYIYAQRNMHKDSISYYEKYLKVYPGEAATLANLGWTYAKLGEYDKALKYYYNALEVNPNKLAVIKNIAYVLEELHRFDEAINMYNLALEKDPNNIGVLTNKLLLLDRLGRPETLSEGQKTIEVCNKIISEQPREVNVLVEKAMALDIVGNKEEAIIWYSKALEIDPRNANALYNKSCTSMLLGNREESLMLLEKAISLGPEYKELAKNDKDFDQVRDDERFKKLLR